MIDTIYIEAAVADHPRTQEICARFPAATQIPCERYGEIFNRKAQNFRLQKKRPALILAAKHQNFVKEAPLGYAIGGQRNYYFSHMLNCLYDCRYCFLQGMFRSAHYILFVNYEDFQQEILSIAQQTPDEDVYFYSGYDCDSLALEPVTHFTEAFLPVFEKQTNAWLELRTKSTQVRGLLDRDPLQNCVVAFSLNPDAIARELEHKAPNLERRLQALEKCQTQGWPIGLRFDPLIYRADYREQYQALFDTVFSRVDADRVHSVSLGVFRLPEVYYKNTQKLYPDDKLFAEPLYKNNGVISYSPEQEAEMLSDCEQMLSAYLPDNKVFPCLL